MCLWGVYSAGGAPAFASMGSRFDPGHVHRKFPPLKVQVLDDPVRACLEFTLGFPFGAGSGALVQSNRLASLK